MKLVDIVAPKPVEQNIFGKPYLLRRLSMSDLIRLMEHFDVSELKNKERLFNSLLRSGGDALRELLSMSFPTFEDWDAVPSGNIPYLIELIWETNDVGGLLKNFTELAGKIAQMQKPRPQPQDAEKSPER